MLTNAAFSFLFLLTLAGCVQSGYQPVYIISQTPAEEAQEEPQPEKEDIR